MKAVASLGCVVLLTLLPACGGGSTDAPVRRAASVRLVRVPGNVRTGVNQNFSVAADAVGNVVAATSPYFQGPSGPIERIRRSRRGRWTPTAILDGSDRRSSEPSVAAGGPGSAAIAWGEHGRSGRPSSVVVVRAGHLQRLPGLMHGALHPSVGVDGAGNAVVAWDAAHIDAEADFPSGPLALAWCPAHRGCTRPHLFGSTAISEPQVALSRSGRGVLAWTENRPRHARHLVKAAVLRDGRVGRTATLGISKVAFAPTVAVADDGAALVAWYAPGGRIVYSRRSAHGSFSRATKIGDDKSDNVFVAGGPRGVLALGYTDYLGSTSTPFVAVSAPHSRLGPPVPLTTNNPGSAHSELRGLTIDSLGRAAALTLSDDGGGNAVFRLDSQLHYTPTTLRSPEPTDRWIAAELVSLPGDQVLAVLLPATPGSQPRSFLAAVVSRAR